MREGEMATRLQMKRRVRRTQGPGVERKNVSSPGSILGYLSTFLHLEFTFQNSEHMEGDLLSLI